MPYGDRFRKHRRLISQVLNLQAVVQFRGLQTSVAQRLLKDLLSEPEKFEHHILRFAAQLAHSVLHSYIYSGNLTRL